MEKMTLTRTDAAGSVRMSSCTLQQMERRLKSNRRATDGATYELYPGVDMRRTKEGTDTVRAYNGVTVLTIGQLHGEAERDAVKQSAMTLPMTKACLNAAEGDAVKILVAYAPESGTMPTEEKAAEALAASAYEQAVVNYCRVTGHGIRREEPSVRLHLTLGHDSHPLINTSPTPLALGKNGMETLRLIEFINARYQLRYNVVMGYTEYQLRNDTEGNWLPADDRVVNAMTMAARLAGMDVWDKDVKRYVLSVMVESYNPVETFLKRASKAWDGHTDHIGQLAQTVPCEAPQWPRWFRKWLLYMVAQWAGLTRRYGNATAPLLISEQGNNKSTFCRQLLPECLQWGYNDNLLISEKKQTLQAMSQFLLINLDEFNQISAKIQEGFLKNVIQLAHVKIKRPYGRHVEDFPRLASFIGTTNETSVLADPTGNRRFIGIRLTGSIDVSRPIDYEGLYGQAITLVEQGEQYWFDDDEVREIMEHNRQFQVKSPAEQWFLECFDVATDENNGQWMTCAAIYSRVRKAAGSSLRDSLSYFGRVLNNISGLSQRHSKLGKQYLVRSL